MGGGSGIIFMSPLLGHKVTVVGMGKRRW